MNTSSQTSTVCSSASNTVETEQQASAECSAACNTVETEQQETSTECSSVCNTVETEQEASTKCSSACNAVDTTDGEESVEDCGCEIRCWCFRTKRQKFVFLSALNSPTGALVFLSIVAFLEGMVVNGLYNVSVTTLERRFGLRSFETGLITSALDIAGCVATLVTSYVGGTGNKPLWIGSGALIMGVGSIVFSLPHFIAPTYTPFDIGSLNCSSPDTCSGEPSLRTLRGFFFAGFVLIGIGATPVYTLSIAYLDENVNQARSAMFSGIFFACALLGPGVGFIFGGYILTFFTTMGDPGEITPESTAWVGNWWLGFVVVGVLFILFAIPLYMYPVRIPGTEKHRKNRENDIQHSAESIKAQSDDNFGKSIRDAPRATWILMKNPTIVIISIATALDSGLLIGIATFGPKYIESLFGLTASDAALYFGAVAIACAASGHLLSGFLISRLKLNVGQMLKMCVVTSAASFACYFMFLRSCENPAIVGAFVPYPGEEDVQCKSSSCGCYIELFRPVCGSNNLTYMSFCDAGCESAAGQSYANCSKITHGGVDIDPTATSGICVNDTCPNLALFLVVVGLAVFFTFFNAQPALQCSLRVVMFSQRSFCLGFQWMITRLLGSIPIPIIYGRVLDLSCKLWGMECGECSSCRVYDNYSMSYYMSWLCLSLKGLSMICQVVAVLTLKPSSSSSESLPSQESTENTRL